MRINRTPTLHHHDLLSTEEVNNFLLRLNQQPIYKRRRLLNLTSQIKPYTHFIYKFLPLATDKHADYLRNYLVESKLWLSSPTAFNDPFDMSCQYIFEGKPQDKRKHLDKRFKLYDPNLPKKQREKIISNSLASGQFLTETLNSIHEKHRKEDGVCCFSENTRNILTWAHYGSNHAGLSLRFQISKDLFIFTRAIKVEYSDEYPIIDYLKDSLGDAIAQTLLRKSKAWEYENERRIIHPNGANCYLQFNPSALTALILGCEFEVNTEKIINIKTLLDERMEKNYPPVKIFRAIRDKSKYRLLIKRERNLFEN